MSWNVGAMTKKRKITRKIADGWVQKRYIQSYNLPDGLTEEQETELLTSMFDFGEAEVEGEREKKYIDVKRTNKIVYVDGNDWNALYINGELKYEGHDTF